MKRHQTYSHSEETLHKLKDLWKISTKLKCKLLIALFCARPGSDKPIKVTCPWQHPLSILDLLDGEDLNRLN
jgi:hypothetical protein